MRQALSDLNLKQIDVIHAGDNSFQLSRQIRAIAASDLLTEMHSTYLS